MPLAMARPWKHPKTGIYWLRKRVPEDLLRLVGKREEKRSLALLRAEILDFWHQRHSAEEIGKRDSVLTRLRAQEELFSPASSLIPSRTCPYSFHYRYRDDDGVHEGTCQDWETEQTFFARTTGIFLASPHRASTSPVSSSSPAIASDNIARDGRTMVRIARHSAAEVAAGR